MGIRGKEIRTGRMRQSVIPHDHAHVLADYHEADIGNVTAAIDAALQTRRTWSETPWYDRAAVCRDFRSSHRAAGPYTVTLTSGRR